MRYLRFSSRGLSACACAVLALSGLAPAAASAAGEGRTWYVAPDGDDGNDGTSSDKAFYSLSVALASAASNDVIRLAAGEYAEMTPVANTMTYKEGWYSRYTDSLGIVTNAVSIIGAGEDKTILRCRSVHGSTGYEYRPNGLWVNHPQASVTGLACSGANDSHSNDDKVYKEGAAFHILAGTVQNCRAFNNGTGGKTYGRQPTVYVSGTGRFLDGIVTNNILGTYGKSAAVRVDGGEVRRTYVARNGGPNCAYCGSEPVGANGILQLAGTVSDCVIRDNTSYSVEVKSYGILAGGAYVGGGVFERCVVSGNTNPTATATERVAAGGVYVAGTGEVRNCLVLGNVVNSALATSAGGIVIDGEEATVLHCTVTDNEANAGVAGLLQYDGTVAGCVVSGNRPTALPQVSALGGEIGWSCFPEATSADGNISDNPMLVDVGAAIPTSVSGCTAARLAASSPARDAVDVANLVTDDLVGNVRPVWTQGAADIADMGCYETVAQSPVTPVVYLSVPTMTGPVGGTFSVIAQMDAQDRTVKSCHWEVYTTSTSHEYDTGTSLTLSVSDLPAGRYGVRVVVVNGSDRQGEAEKAEAFYVLPRKCYVGKTGKNAVWPYDTEETAAVNLKDALAAVWGAPGDPGEIQILDGDYSGMTTETYLGSRAMLGILDKPVKVVGNDAHPESVVLRFNVTKQLGGGIVVVHPQALLSGVTLSGIVKGDDNNKTVGCGITLVDGVVTNCQLTGCYSNSNRSQVPFSVAGGLAVDCRVFANTNGATAWKPVCMGVCVSGGTLLRAKILDNSCPNVEASDVGAGLRMTGGEARDCLIVGNYVDTSSDKLTPVAGVYMENGNLVNCTVANNAAGTRNEIRGLRISNGEVVNSIVWGNTGGAGVNTSLAGGTVTYTCCEDEISGDGNRRCDPLFKNSASDFRLSAGSPVVNKGLLLSGMSAMMDLAGKPRLVGSRPDLGCYECQTLPGLAIVIR